MVDILQYVLCSFSLPVHTGAIIVQVNSGVHKCNISLRVVVKQKKEPYTLPTHTLIATPKKIRQYQ